MKGKGCVDRGGWSDHSKQREKYVQKTFNYTETNFDLLQIVIVMKF